MVTVLKSSVIEHFLDTYTRIGAEAILLLCGMSCTCPVGFFFSLLSSNAMPIALAVRSTDFRAIW